MGQTLFFGADKWLNGQSIADLAPHLLAGIPKRIVNKRTVEEALTDRAWVLDIRGIMTMEVTVEFLNL